MRHLVMPGGLDETREILQFLAREVPPHTFVNVIPQYRPKRLASRYPAIAQPLAPREFRQAAKIAGKEGLRLARD